MIHAARTLLYFLFAGIGLTLIASGMMWWFEASRRLARALNAALGRAADAVVYDLGGHKAAGLDFTAGDLAIMWNTGAQGLVFAFDEIDGAELIVDERVVARAQKGETRRVLNETHAQASKVTLRLMFADVETPEFEINLFGEISHNPVHAKTASEAVRLGRKWLSHIDAVIKRQPAAPRPPSRDEDDYASDDSGNSDHHFAPPRIRQPAGANNAQSAPPWDDDDDDGLNDTYRDEMR